LRRVKIQMIKKKNKKMMMIMRRKKIMMRMMRKKKKNLNKSNHKNKKIKQQLRQPQIQTLYLKLSLKDLVIRVMRMILETFLKNNLEK